MTKEEAGRKAREIINAVETACGEVAMEAVEGTNFGEFDIPDCGDPSGALADNLYNDTGFLEDMIGDRVYDAANSSEERGQVLDALEERGHSGIQVACQNIRGRHPEWKAE